MGDNIIINTIKMEEEKRKKLAETQTEWGIMQRNKLVEILENAGAKITNHVYDLLLFNINALRINSEGKIYYLSLFKESKKITDILRRYHKDIVANFNYITE